jgi:hypothetical protein
MPEEQHSTFEAPRSPQNHVRTGASPMQSFSKASHLQNATTGSDLQLSVTTPTVGQFESNVTAVTHTLYTNTMLA